MVENSPWFQTLTHLQKMSLSFNMRLQPEHRFFRDFRPSFGRTRVSPRGSEDGADESIAIAGTCMPTQMVMVFNDTPDWVPRVMLGRESLWLQGVPIEMIESMPTRHKEPLLTDLAGNMVSTPIFVGDTPVGHGIRMLARIYKPRGHGRGSACGPWP